MEQTTLPVVAGVIASVLTELINRTGAKVPHAVLQATAFTIAALGVVGWRIYSGGAAGVDWNAVIPQVIAAWGVALGAHDLASPRKEAAKP